MSTIKVNNIDPRNTGETVSVNSIAMPSAGALSNRSKIINGAMVHDQRNAGSAVTHTGSANLYVLDRWVCNSTGTPQFSVQRVADGPTGFSYSSKLTTTTSGTPAAGDLSYYAHYIEGNNVADLVFGTANAKTITVSFYVKSSLTGTFGGALKNAVPNRAYPFSYTITSANTWEYKTVTIAGDTTGTWATDATIGLNLAFDTGSGSNNKGTAGAWAATADLGVTGGVNLVESASATWQITGVQLETGTNATPFEYRSYGDELLRCSRYFVYANWQFCSRITGLTTRFIVPGPGVVQRILADVSYFHPATGTANQAREHSSGTAYTINDANDMLSNIATASQYFGVTSATTYDVNVGTYYDAEL